MENARYWSGRTRQSAAAAAAAGNGAAAAAAAAAGVFVQSFAAQQTHSLCIYHKHRIMQIVIAFASHHDDEELLVRGTDADAAGKALEHWHASVQNGRVGHTLCMIMLILGPH